MIAPIDSHAQKLVVHDALSIDDGNPEKDGDGVKNKVVVWTAGAMHVVNGDYVVDKGEKLIIQSGAIVKFVDEIDYVDGVVRSFKGPTSTSLFSQHYYDDPGGIIQIDGATLTDFRDDAVGGDWNQDGAATTPTNPPSSLAIRFSGTSEDRLVGSTLKYFAKIGHIGSMTIADNDFTDFLSISSTSGYPVNAEPVPPSASPRITGNTFNFIRNNGFLDLRGMTPIVEGNTFRGNGASWVLQLGPKWSISGNGEIRPRSGTAVVSNNIFETKGGVIVDASGSVDSLFTKVKFSGIIRNNTFRSADGVGETAISVCIDADVQVLENIVENFTTPVTLNFDRGSFGSSSSPLQIHRNRFNLVPGGQGPNNENMFTRKGVMINAEDNYWGDPSGPLDNSNADGLYNPRGKGLRIGDGIDYRPFIGGTEAERKDYIRISATASPTPLVPKDPATINVVVEQFALASSPAGKIIVVVRDANGYTINQPEATVNITSQSTSVTIPPIQITVPELGTAITVDAYVVPDGDLPVVGSNRVQFDVPQPKSAFRFIGAYDPATGLPLIPVLTQGASINARIDFEYTHVASNVHFEIMLTEREVGTGKVLGTIHQSTFTVPAGTNRKESKTFAITLPLRDVTVAKSTELYGVFVAKDDAGNIIGKVDGRLPVFPAANINVSDAVSVRKVGGQTQPGPGFFEVGEPFGYKVTFNYSVVARNISDWQIWMGPVEILNDAGAVILTYPTAGPVISSIATGLFASRERIVIPVDGAPVIPDGAYKARIRVRLVSPQGNITVATSFIDVNVLPRPTKTVQLNVATGAQTLAFAPIPVSLTFATNQQRGIATAQEFNGQFRSTVAKARRSIQAFSYWKMIPLNRFWAVFDTLAPNSYTATIAITYDPATDFPSVAEFNEDSLVICGFNRYSGELEELPTTLDKSSHRVTAEYSKFFDIYVVASRSTKISGPTDAEDILPRPLPEFISYPNPLGERTTFRFELPSGSDVRLEIVDMTGARVALLKNGWLAKGMHEVEWIADEIPAGIYLARLGIGGTERELTIIRTGK
jgi:hypothetical protein